MMINLQPDSTARVSTDRWRAAAPIAVLIFLAPVLAELLMGVVSISKLWLLVPEMGVYGLAALIIREVSRRRQRGWGTILLLGMAYALAEECVILQTSLTPQFFPPAFSSNFGWAFGVQWINLAAMMWYESVYAIVLPIYLTELLFPSQRDQLWLDRRGLLIAAVVFVLSAIGVWQLWSNVGLQHYGNSDYRVPAVDIAIALIVIAAVATGTLLFQRSARSTQAPSRRSWSPWLVGILAFGHGLVWFMMIILAYLPATLLPGVTPLIPLAIGLVWVALGLLIVRYLSAAQGWGDRHRLALIFGASLASMLGGVIVVLAAAPIDQLGKLIFDVIAIVLFAYFAWRLRRSGRGEGVRG